jgi:hypothetical protein
MVESSEILISEMSRLTLHSTEIVKETLQNKRIVTMSAVSASPRLKLTIVKEIWKLAELRHGFEDFNFKLYLLI